MNDFSKNRIFIGLGISLGVFFLVWFFLYLPTRMNTRNIKKNLSDVDNQIKQIETVVDQDKNIDQMIKSLEEKFSRLESKFPPKEEEAFSFLADLARESNIKIVSIRSQPKTVFMAKNNQEVLVENKKCYQIPVSLEIKSSYQDLLRYIEALDLSLPSLVVVNRIQISKDQAGTAILNINMDLNLYLLL